MFKRRLFIPNRYLYILFTLLFACTSNKTAPETKVPDHMPKFEVLINEFAFDDYIFLKKVVGPGALLMINNLGEIIWFQESDTTLVRPFMPYVDSYVTLESDSLLHQISYSGDTLLEMELGKESFDRPLHHEVLLDTENNFVAITNETILMDLSSVGGDLVDTLKTHGIIKFNKKGEKLFSWDITKVIDPLDYPNINTHKKDWGHANSMCIDTDGNYILSWRDFHQLWKIDSKSGSLIWKTGIDTELPDSLIFYNQHAVHRDAKGRLILFDNGDNRKRKNSRYLALNTPVDGDFEFDFQIVLPDSLFSFKQGNVYEINENAFLFNSSMTNYLIITNREGKIMWLAKSDHSFYRAYYVSKEIIKGE